MDSKDEANKKEEEILYKRALRKIHEIVKESSDGEYIYRGQPDAAHLQVSSTLYRAMVESCPEFEGAKWLNVNRVQEEELKVVRKFSSEGYDDKEMLSRIQHYSGNTNLIDFAKDYLVALFFACNQEYDKNGKVFLLEISNSANLKNNGIEMVNPEHPPNRVVVQKSVFIQPLAGIIPNDMKDVTMKVVTINCDLKQPILDYLKARHDISVHTIYNDLHGYIKNHKAHDNAVKEFHRGFFYGCKSDEVLLSEGKNDILKEAIEYFDKAIRLDPNYSLAYYNRGFAKGKLGDVEDAISDYDKAIDLDSNFAIAYNNRGIIKEELNNVKGAISDYDKAIASDSNFVKAYINRGKAKEKLGDRQNLQEALSDWENLEKLARKQNDHKTAKFAQQGIERVTAKIAEMNES